MSGTRGRGRRVGTLEAPDHPDDHHDQPDDGEDGPDDSAHCELTCSLGHATRTQARDAWTASEWTSGSTTDGVRPQFPPSAEPSRPESRQDLARRPSSTIVPLGPDRPSLHTERCPHPAHTARCTPLGARATVHAMPTRHRFVRRSGLPLGRRGCRRLRRDGRAGNPPVRPCRAATLHGPRPAPSARAALLPADHRHTSGPSGARPQGTQPDPQDPR